MRWRDVSERCIRAAKYPGAKPISIDGNRQQRASIAAKHERCAQVARILNHDAHIRLHEKAAYEIKALLRTGRDDHLIRIGWNCPIDRQVEAMATLSSGIPSGDP